MPIFSLLLPIQKVIRKKISKGAAATHQEEITIVPLLVFFAIPYCQQADANSSHQKNNRFSQ